MNQRIFNRRHYFGIWVMSQAERLLEPRFRKDFGDWLRFGACYLPANWEPDDKITVTRERAE
jgi:hypothetical protein